MSDGRNDKGGVSAMAMAMGGMGVAVLALGATATYTFRQRTAAAAAAAAAVTSPVRDLEGITAVVTGGNIGIGRAVAIKLGQRGAKILIGCRNLDQAKEVCQLIGNHKCHAFALDLASAASVEAFTKSIVNETTRTGLQLLVNNAGAMITEKDKETDDGWDRSMAVNHLGWVQLTRNLLPVLEKTAAMNASSSSSSSSAAAAAATTIPVRVVNVGSKLEKGATLPNDTSDPTQWDQWMKTSITPYGPFPAYANAKLAMTAVTFHWANLLTSKTSSNSGSSSSSVEMMIISPGMVNTSLPRFLPLWQRVLSLPFRALLLKTPAEAADTVLFAALDPSGHSGMYYSGGQEIQDSENCSEAARSPVIGKAIWESTLRALEQRK